MFEGSVTLPRRLLQAPPAPRRQHQRLDLVRPDELLRRPAHRACRAGPGDGIGPDGQPARRPRRTQAEDPEGRGQERVPAELRQPAVRDGLEPDRRGALPPAAPLQLADDRRDGGRRAGDEGRRRGVLPPVLRPEQRQPRHRRRHRRGPRHRPGRALLRRDPGRGAGAPALGRGPGAGRGPRGRAPRPGRARPGLPGLADGPALPRRRRAADAAGRHPGPGPVEPALSQARGRGADRAGRHRLPVGPRAGRHLRDRRHAAAVAVDRRGPRPGRRRAGPPGRGRRGGRGAARACRTCGSPASSSPWRTSAASAAWRTGSTPTTSSWATRP